MQLSYLSLRLIKKGAFTLIELLVVIAIIAILAAILFPVFGRASFLLSVQPQADRPWVMQYTQDYDEAMPFNASAGLALTQWVQPYIKSYQLFRCPSDSNANIPGEGNANSSYAINLVGKNEKPNSNPNSCPFSRLDNSNVGVVTVSALAAPSTTITVADNNSNNAWQNAQNWADSSGLVINNTTPRNMNSNWSERHLETINALFADGHVKAVKLDYFREPATGGTKATRLTIGADPE